MDETKSYLKIERESLACRLREGDRDAAEAFVDLYYQQIYVFMRRLGYDSSISEDLTQECFLTAWHHIGQLKNGRALNTWFYRIAANVSRGYIRRQRLRKTEVLQTDLLFGGSNEDVDQAEYLEQMNKLKSAVFKLPVKLRETIVIHYMQQLTIAEAAEAIGVRAGTFKSRLSRALKKLRDEIS